MMVQGVELVLLGLRVWERAGFLGNVTGPDVNGKIRS